MCRRGREEGGRKKRGKCIAPYRLNETPDSYHPRESEGLCFYRRRFVCLSVCLFVTTITK